MNWMAQLLIGLAMGVLIAAAAYKAQALSFSGAVAAALSGGLVFGLGGLSWALLLLGFFISSSGLSRAFAKRKAGLSEKFSKGSRRDWAQVLANGGLGALLAVLHVLLPGQAWPWWAFAGAMAAVNADTWATELGVLSKTPPRLLTTLRPVERGESGAVSALGTLAAFSGAALIGLLAALGQALDAARLLGAASPVLPPQALALAADGQPQAAAMLLGGGQVLALTVPGGLLWLVLAVALAGLAGALFDSLLGATVQAIYWCPDCRKETERHPLHLCGAPTTHRRGWSWMDNDVVNFLASLSGALAACAAMLLL
ncbi:MAG: DUF92 domain-containing protein [Chloroflexota bacterium]